MKIKTGIAAFALAVSFGTAHAQDIPPLADVIQNLDPAELQQMRTVGGQIEPISGDVDAVITSAVNDAIKEGVISAEQADDATASLTIINANAQFFDFDILATIGDILADPQNNGQITMADIRSTLEGFNKLSDAGKAVVGREEFDAGDINQLNQLSQPDKDVVLSLPVFQHDAQCAQNPGGQGC